MRLPRSVSGKELIKALEPLGYRITRQSGSHIRLTSLYPTQHHVTIPNHDPIRTGTLSAIISDLAEHLKMNRSELVSRLFCGKEK